MGRLQAYENLRQHPWYCKLLNRLTPVQDKTIIDFITKNDELDPVQFARLVNGLGGSQKFQLTMAEVLTVVNAQAVGGHK